MENQRRNAPIEIDKADFIQSGYALVERLADFYAQIGENPITSGESPEQLCPLLGSQKLPEKGQPVPDLLTRTTELLLNHSLFNGHPRFMGYITSSPAPIGALADMLAAAVNPNVGANILSPMATEIEKQTIHWLSDLIGVPRSYGGLLVSGGNMANFTGFLAGRTAKAPKEIKEAGLQGTTNKLLVYASKATHTWIDKAANLFGFGTDAIRWITPNGNNQMELPLLEAAIEKDLHEGHQPIMVVATAGDVSTGAVDDLAGIASICKRYNLWFHVDGAYGAPAAVLPEYRDFFAGLKEADSIALDPHKWLYAPLEAGCTLVKDPKWLLETFSSHPEYYNFSSTGHSTLNYYEYGLQNSRGFRALKVWLILQQVGRSGYELMIREDILLSQLLFRLADEHPRLEAATQNLSITTLRYIPEGFEPNDPAAMEYLNTVNETLLNELQQEGRVFLSNAVLQGRYFLRSCIVNFRTTAWDIEETIAIIAEKGRQVEEKLKPKKATKPALSQDA